MSDSGWYVDTESRYRSCLMRLSKHAVSLNKYTPYWAVGVMWKFALQFSISNTKSFLSNGCFTSCDSYTEIGVFSWVPNQSNGNELDWLGPIIVLCLTDTFTPWVIIAVSELTEVFTNRSYKAMLLWLLHFRFRIYLHAVCLASDFILHRTGIHYSSSDDSAFYHCGHSDAIW